MLGGGNWLYWAILGPSAGMAVVTLHSSRGSLGLGVPGGSVGRDGDTSPSLGDRGISPLPAQRAASPAQNCPKSPLPLPSKEFPSVLMSPRFTLTSFSSAAPRAGTGKGKAGTIFYSCPDAGLGPLAPAPLEGPEPLALSVFPVHRQTEISLPHSWASPLAEIYCPPSLASQLLIDYLWDASNKFQVYLACEIELHSSLVPQCQCHHLEAAPPALCGELLAGKLGQGGEPFPRDLPPHPMLCSTHGSRVDSLIAQTQHSDLHQILPTQDF